MVNGFWPWQLQGGCLLTRRRSSRLSVFLFLRHLVCGRPRLLPSGQAVSCVVHDNGMPMWLPFEDMQLPT